MHRVDNHLIGKLLSVVWRMIPMFAKWQEFTSGKETILVDILESQIPQDPRNYCMLKATPPPQL